MMLKILSVIMSSGSGLFLFLPRGGESFMAVFVVNKGLSSPITRTRLFAFLGRGGVIVSTEVGKSLG